MLSVVFDPASRLLVGLAFGGLTATASEQQNYSVLTGIITFAVGLIVGLACVLAMDLMVRRRDRRAHAAWLAAGRPERRRKRRDAPSAT
jgi:hypothetical protein